MIPDEIEQTVSEYASQCIDIRAGNALISACEQDGGAISPRRPARRLPQRFPAALTQSAARRTPQPPSAAATATAPAS